MTGSSHSILQGINNVFFLFFFSAASQLITKWEQKSLTLAVTGDARIVRLWDAETELKKQDISTGADCCTTCIDFDDTG